MSKIELVKGDITKQDVHAIVNAAHEGLCGGGGVDGAIHAAAGSMMTGECMNLPENDDGERCPVGDCRITSGYEVPALYIIHTVGPVWRGGDHNERTYLQRCYLSCLDMANSQGLKSIAFPCISTGAFAMPKDVCADIAFKASKTWLELKNPRIVDFIRIVCFDDENYEEYAKFMPDSFIDVTSRNTEISI